MASYIHSGGQSKDKIWPCTVGFWCGGVHLFFCFLIMWSLSFSNTVRIIVLRTTILSIIKKNLQINRNKYLLKKNPHIEISYCRSPKHHGTGIWGKDKTTNCHFCKYHVTDGYNLWSPIHYSFYSWQCILCCMSKLPHRIPCCKSTFGFPGSGLPD